MAIIRKNNPVNEDVPIDKIQVALYDGLITNGAWTNYESYHRAYKNETPNGIRPELFRGTTLGNDYWDNLMNDDFNVTSFFLVPNNIPVEDDMHTANISIIFQANLEKLYPSAPHRFDAEMHNEIENILEGLDGRFSFIDTHTSIADVYEGLDTEKVNWDDMQKFHVVRFEIEAKYQQECNPTFATINCTIGVTVSTTPETSEGADDGTATANDTGGQDVITYLWTTTNGSIPAGEEIKKTATGLSVGNYTVLVTDDNAPLCTASGNGEVGEAPPPPECNISIDTIMSTGVTFPNSTDGTATVMVSGNEGAINYFWQDGQLTQMAIDLPSGHLSVAVTDNGVGATCIDTDIVDVLNAPCLKFDGVNDLISFSTSNNIGNTWSIGYWFWTDMASNGGTVVDTGASGGIYINHHSATELKFYSRGTTLLFTFSESDLVNSVSSVGMTYDGAEVRAYINGVESVTGPLAYAGVTDFVVKRLGVSVGDDFKGKLSHVICENALLATEAQFLSIYNGADPETVFTSPTLYCKLNETSGTTATATYGNDGTLFNFMLPDAWTNFD